MKYELNYRYVPDTLAADAKEIDAYLIGVDEPVERYKGYCIAIIHRKDDLEDKLVIVPEEESFTTSEIMAQVQFQERYFDSVVVR